MRRDVPVHYLRPNDTVWTPPSVIFADTESYTEQRDGFELDRLRLWAAHFLDRREPKRAKPRDEWSDGDTQGELADWITHVTRNRETTWCYFHNLSYDATTTRLPAQLVARGWRINDAAIGGKAPWMRLGLGKRVLTLADSWSWLPHALGLIGETVGERKPDLPGQDELRWVWLERCTADVRILERAILELMAWWDRHQLGKWTISGPSCGWNAYRHKQLTREAYRVIETDEGTTVRRRKQASEAVTIDPTSDLVEQDRAAYHGGRRYVWSIGEHAAGPFTELDLVAAYPTVAATLPLPRGRHRSFTSMDVDTAPLDSDRWGVIAQAVVRTDVPRWPVRAHGGTWYPVGEFVTTLAGPDLAEARRLGCLVSIGPGQVHQLGWNMQPWAEWVLRVQSGAEPDTPAVARMAAKSWGRSVIGKWGARGFERIALGPAPGDGWGFEEGIDHATKQRGGMVDLAGQRFWVAQSGIAENGYPAIPAWVESHVRVRLNRVLEAIGPGALLQCDTDGLIVAERSIGTAAAHGGLGMAPSRSAAGRFGWVLDQVQELVAPLVLRPKQRHDHVTVLGPQHLRGPGWRRYSGLPGMATEEQPNHFRAKLWPKLSWQLAHGTAEGYVRPEVTPVVKGPWPTGWVLDNRRVVPLEAVIDSQGCTRILGWNSTSYARAGMTPAEGQHPRLEPLL